MYTVVRCPACSRCWGIQGRTKMCPHCGTNVSDDLSIVSTVEDASQLQKEVALANLPDEIRDQVENRMTKAVQFGQEPDARELYSALKIAENEGIIHLDRLAGVLRAKGISIDPEDVVQRAISEGLLLDNDDGSFLVLG
ncbi:MAG TPA: hypothetical protein EYQ73_00985 [Candidatus Poseidoniales archaeon]|nr:hypothetical protein [Candidatus Poseidoniales archaeon]HIL64991.1 hypothetical protein [Candidatus Poseidoniales archaeon]